MLDWLFGSRTEVTEKPVSEDTPEQRQERIENWKEREKIKKQYQMTSAKKAMWLERIDFERKYIVKLAEVGIIGQDAVDKTKLVADHIYSQIEANIERTYNNA